MPSWDLRAVRNLVIRVVFLAHKANFNNSPVLSEKYMYFGRCQCFGGSYVGVSVLCEKRV